jgi:hypothetical protein
MTIVLVQKIGFWSGLIQLKNRTSTRCSVSVLEAETDQETDFFPHPNYVYIQEFNTSTYCMFW